MSSTSSFLLHERHTYICTYISHTIIKIHLEHMRWVNARTSLRHFQCLRLKHVAPGPTLSTWLFLASRQLLPKASLEQ